MARSEPQLNFRCPPELRDQLEQAAAASKRSLTQEIVSRLSETIDPLMVWLRASGLSARIESGADVSGRTVHEEVVSVLETHYRNHDDFVRSLQDGTYEEPYEAAARHYRPVIERLEEEAKWLRQTLTDANYIHKRLAQTTQDQAQMLANTLINVLDALPAPIRSRLQAEGSYQYAKGVRDEDLKLIVSGLKQIVGDAEDVREVMAEAQAFVDAKERGDDLSAFPGANFDRMLAERDAGAAPGSHKIDLAKVVTPGPQPAPPAKKRAPKG